MRQQCPNIVIALPIALLATGALGGCDILTAVAGGGGLACSSDDSCPANSHCIEQRCTAAVPCNGNSECADGACVDGVCRPRADAGASDRATDAGRSDAAPGDVARRDRTVADGAAGDGAAGDVSAVDGLTGDTAASDRAAADAAAGRDAALADAATARDAHLGPVEVCALHRTFLGNRDLCREAALPSALGMDGLSLTLGCRPGATSRRWADELLAAEAAGRVAIDWEVARACLDAARALRIGHSASDLLDLPAWSVVQQDDCSDFFHGVRALDESCVLDWDCAEGGCNTDDPYSTAASRCLLPATVGADCLDGYWPCAAGLYCNSANHCSNQRDPGALCGSAAECRSGACSTTCEAMPLTTGTSCFSNDRCADACTACRAPSASGTRSCLRLARRGEYCAVDEDCLHDLDCIDNLCATWPAGAACGYQLGHHCDPGLTCVPEHDCPSMGGSSSCYQAGPTCSWDPDNGCFTVQGTCSGDLPSSGSCLFGRICAAGFCCSPALDVCQPCAGLDAPCTVDGSTLAVCAPGLRCAEGRCAIRCTLPEDCPGSSYCDSSTGECVPNASLYCDSNSQCEREQYCSSSNRCVAKKQPGSNCGGDGECASGICYDDRCTVASETACGDGEKTHTPDYLRAVFLLGGIWFTLGRRRNRVGG